MQVCDDWFARIRPLLLRLSLVADKHTSVIQHAHATLAGLKQQMRAILADYESRAAELEAAQVRCHFTPHPHHLAGHNVVKLT